MSKEMQVLVFSLGGQYWGLNILDVREVVKIKNYTQVPGAQDYILGVFNLRGQIVPLLDISVFLNTSRGNELREAVIISLDSELIGIAVEDVIGVYRVDESEITPPPNEVGDHVGGIVNIKNKTVNIIDLKKIINKVSGGTALQY
ncbi:MAG: purine-binding chemotaxis protein CheW [Staphylothermus sp.]|nr:purine-binding chemotaxis protein CheW [Staphylothermus sp.]